MKYFTRELYAFMQASTDDEMDAADAEWERAVDRYDQRLGEILPHMPDHIREFVQNLLLHDADVLSMARRDGQFILVLRKDIPPRDVVLITYQLVAEPVIDKNALPPDHCSPAMQFMYDELDLIQEDGRQVYTESILFSNGWEVHLRFSDVSVELAQPVYPLPGTTLVPSGTAAAPQPV